MPDRRGRPGFDPARRRAVDSARSWGAAIDEWADKNLTVAFAAKTQSAITDAKQTGASRLHALDSAPGANAELGHAADPVRVTVNLLHFGPFADLQHLEREQRWHQIAQGNRN
jgi:hypothetical protein